jgi:pimeloyl-ACP methyl ester carboxylesterase
MPRYIPDEIYFPAPPPHPISSSSTSPNPTSDNHHHIIFLPGNPGCVAYYEAYLAHLHSLLNEDKSASSNSDKPRYTIYARSYPGFTVNPSTTTSALSLRFPAHVSGSWSLQRTIDFAEAVIQRYVSQLATKSSSPARGKAKIILVAHSLGTFITLELLRRRNARLASLSKGSWSSDAQFDITTAVLLFPTVMDLALSTNGEKFSWVVKQRYTATVVAAAAWVFVRVLTCFGLFGDAALVGVVKAVTGMTEDAAGVTARWLATSRGVYQAIKLAGDEMREITHDRWDEDVWGAMEGGGSEGKGRKTKMLFYYGETDHWVADRTRDELIAARGGSGKLKDADGDFVVVDAADVEDGDPRPRMVIGEVGIPHGFCIRHSEAVAKITAEYLKEVVR